MNTIYWSSSCSIFDMFSKKCAAFITILWLVEPPNSNTVLCYYLYNNAGLHTTFSMRLTFWVSRSTWIQNYTADIRLYKGLKHKLHQKGLSPWPNLLSTLNDWWWYIRWFLKQSQESAGWAPVGPLLAVDAVGLTWPWLASAHVLRVEFNQGVSHHSGQSGWSLLNLVFCIF